MAQKNKPLHADHRSRMRTRFNGDGFDGYHAHEVLEQLLFECIPRVNTNETAHLLINEFGSLENVLRASAEDLQRVHGIGKASAEYLASRLDALSDMILEQYRGIGNLNPYEIAFLTDWFMRGIDKRNFGLIVCGNDEKFKDFLCVFDAEECDEIPCEMDLEALCDIANRIVDKVGEGSYCLIMHETVIERSDLYRILDETRREGAIMLNAYIIKGKMPLSVIYPN